MRKIYQSLQVLSLFCLLSVLSISAAYAQVDITFRVNMEGQDVSNGVWMTGELNAWAFTELAKEGETDIYNVTLSLESGAQFIYYFRNAANWDATSRETVPAECSNSNEKVGGWDGDRMVTVPAVNETLEVVFYSGCSAEGGSTSLVDPEKDQISGISINAYNDKVHVIIKADLLQNNSAIIELLDVNGRIINKMETRETNTYLNSNRKGVYFVRVSIGDLMAVEKIVLL